MVQPVAENGIALTRQSADRRHVRGEARGKEDGGRLRFEPCQALFKGRVPARPTADEGTGTGADADLIESRSGGGDDDRVAGEIQVMVRREVEELTTISSATPVAERRSFPPPSPHTPRLAPLSIAVAP